MIDSSETKNTTEEEDGDKPEGKVRFPKRDNVIVEYRGNEERNHLENRIQNELKSGSIPKLIKESTFLIEEGEDENADRVIAYIRGILDRLSMASHGVPHPDVKIVISENDQSLASIYTEANPPIICVETSFLKKLAENDFGEDHLAAVLGHERFHMLRHEKFEHLKNGRPEETFADIYGLKEAAAAGYNPRALGDFYRLMRKEERARHKRNVSSLYRIFGEHPSWGNRIRNTDIAMAELQLRQEMRDDFEIIPREILASTNEVTYITTFEKYKEKVGYETLSPPEKMRVIGDYFMAELYKSEANVPETEYVYEGKGDNRRRNRERDIHYIRKERDGPLMALRLYLAFGDLEDLIGQEGVKEEAYRQLRRFMKADIDEGRRYRYKSVNIEDHYVWVMKQFLYAAAEKKQEPAEYKNYDGTYDLPDGHDERKSRKHQELLPPVFKKILTEAENFWVAETPEQAVQSAKIMMQAERVLKAYDHGLSRMGIRVDRPNWPTRKEIRRTLNDGNVVTLPWNKHLEWLSSDNLSDEDKSVLANILKEFHVDDPRFTGADAAEFKMRQWGREEYSYADLKFDDDGNIIYLEMDEEEKLQVFRDRFEMRGNAAAPIFKACYEAHLEREEADHIALASVDWSQMDDDFWGFVEKYEEALEPTYNVAGGRYVFAEKFMQELRKRVDSGEEKWTKIYDAFITGSDPSFEMDRNSRREEARPFSLPDLLKRAEHKYFGYATHYDNFRRGFRGKRGALADGHPAAEALAKLKDKRKPQDKTIWEDDGKRRHYKKYPSKVKAENEEVEFSISVPLDHPYAKAILDYDGQDLFPSRKANLLSHFDCYNESAENVEAYFKIDPRRVFNQASFAKPSDFNEYYEKTNDHPTNMSPDHRWYLAEPIELINSLRENLSRKTPHYFNLSELSHRTVNYQFSDVFHDWRLAKKTARTLKDLVDEQIQMNAAIDLSSKTPLKKLIERYVSAHKKDRWRTGHNIFENRPKLSVRYQRAIISRIQKLPKDDRVTHLEKLMAVEIRDPEMRNKVVDLWVNAMARQLGKDDKSERYKNNCEKILLRIVRKVESAQGLASIVKLLDKIEAQREISFMARDMLVDYYGAKFLEKDGAMRMLEAIIETCANDPELRLEFMDYITNQMTKESTARFTSLLKEKAPNSDFVKRFHDKDRGLDLPLMEQYLNVEYLHRNFWAMPFEIRTIYLDRILFPVDQEDQGSFDEAVTFVLDKVLPPAQKFAAEAREALLVYLDTCPHELRRTTFSAILASTKEATGEDGALRPGQVLSYVLTRTGAAGGQLLQAGHSYLSSLHIDDPDLIQFRDDLKDSKVAFDVPKRWEIFERMDEALPQEMRDNIEGKKVGAVLGSGSTAYVVSLGITALKLMRKDVISIAHLQFDRFYEAFTELASRHEHYKALPGLVGNARQMIAISANGDIARAQIDYAAGEYDDLSVRVNGTRYHFNVAKSVSSGAEFIETIRIHGKHLNDFEYGNIKQQISLAIETAEIYRSLAGRAIDRDRHGGQQGIKGQKIGMFDVGQMPYDLEQSQIDIPDQVEKRTLGRLWAHLFNAAARGENVSAALTNAVTDNDWGAATDFITSEQRALLARMDVHAGLGQSDEARKNNLSSVFAAVWNNAQIDQDVFQGMCEIVRPMTVFKLMHAQLSQKAANDIEIEGYDDVPRLTSSKMVRTATGAIAQRIKASLG